MTPDPKILAQLEGAGVAIVPDVLPRDEALALRPLLQQAIDEDLARWKDAPSYLDGWMVHNLMMRGRPFLHLLENPVLHAYLGALLSDTCIVYAYTSSSMPPGGSNYSRRLHVDSPRVIPGYVTNVGITLALDDFTEENGATQALPYSQERLESPSEREFERDAVRLMPRAGEAIMFNARIWHRGGVNRSSAPRHAVTINACHSFMRQRFDYPRLVPQVLVDELGPVGRRFLGFNVRVPTSLEDYYVPEDRRLYKSGQG